MTAFTPTQVPSRNNLWTGFVVQCRVIGALILRELHTRYGRENIGYLWLVAEPMLLASVIGSLHMTGHTEYGSDIHPLPFTIVGYTTFIQFRGIVNRSEGAVEANAPLLYHRMVSIFDIVMSRALIEAAGCLIAYLLLMTFLIGIGLANFPARPIYYMLALLFMFWVSLIHSLIIAAISHENRTVGRLVHPYTYFMIPLSGAFFQMSWISEPYRSWLGWFPLTHILEMARYGQFHSANLKYVNIGYLTAVCLVGTWVGLTAVKLLRNRIHLS
ncbi:capsular polysaccharide transport system permease protein [Sphingomonas vulcanisoli]|uniref:Capsular polysaccharide transport system permease protein n=1 Tax=Sphingomonas vulcanisoli TaxID=1658060 RepID=A0ABX0TYZ9_9SPHN|nr:ABC transporter permease [Sphingomonas vulcanisoli]NIJ09439.1 capsular polysaccharide transport system permease protein [Sphingomonas vulcanisoli]